MFLREKVLQNFKVEAKENGKTINRKNVFYKYLCRTERKSCNRCDGNRR